MKSDRNIEGETIVPIAIPSGDSNDNGSRADKNSRESTVPLNKRRCYIWVLGMIVLPSSLVAKGKAQLMAKEVPWNQHSHVL
eukprot:12038318-Ditylum_brightwellii.AAC.1